MFQIGNGTKCGKKIALVCLEDGVLGQKWNVRPIPYSKVRRMD